MLRYRFVQRQDMSEGAGPDAKLFYPQLVPGNKVSFEELCEQSAEESALTSADIKACMDRVIRCLARNLMNGNPVDCGDLGSFRINLRSEGSITKEGYDPETMMRTPKLVFTPGMVLKDVREKATYTRVTKKPEGEETTEGGEETESPGTV